MSVKWFACAIIDTILNFKQRHPRMYENNKHVFDVIENNAELIAEEIYRFFKENEWELVFTIAIWTKPKARWHRSQIAFNIYRNGKGDIEIGKKLDRYYTTQSKIVKSKLTGVRLW